MGKDATVTSLTQENRRLQEESKLSARRSSQLNKSVEKNVHLMLPFKSRSASCALSLYTYVRTCMCAMYTTWVWRFCVRTALVCMYVYVWTGAMYMDYQPRPSVLIKSREHLFELRI